MYNLQLTSEQLEFRDTVHDFVQSEIKPAATHPSRLEPFEKPLMTGLLGQASAMGLRSLALSEEAGGAGADTLTSCIVLEELGAGDVDIAVALGETARLAHLLFDREMSAAQRDRYLPDFVADEAFHLAFAGAAPDALAGWDYYEAATEDQAGGLTATRQGDDWVIDGTLGFVANAPIAKLFAVEARTGSAKTAFLVPRDAAGLTVGGPVAAIGETLAGGEAAVRWHYGTGAGVAFEDCRVPADGLLGAEGQSPFADGAQAMGNSPELAAINLGIGRAAHEAAVEYAGIRRQGGRNIVEHQSIGSKIADMAIKLELARTMIWKAAWVKDHPEAVADRSASDLPLAAIARIYTAEAIYEVTLAAAECFGAMGVMRDMPLQKYVHDGLAFLHSDTNSIATRLRISEAVTGYRR